MLAVVLQLDLHAVAIELTNRCTAPAPAPAPAAGAGVGADSKTAAPAGAATTVAAPKFSERLTFMGGDFLSLSRHLATNRYHAIVSWLTVLHFPKSARHQLFTQSASLLETNGLFYAEDFVCLGELTSDETRVLRNDVYCDYLPDRLQYISDLKAAGLTDIQTTDLTADWTKWTAERYQSFQSDAKVQTERHGADLYHRLLFFYRQIAGLFAGGRVGGIRIVARKPKGLSVADLPPPSNTGPLKRQATY